MNYRGFIIDIDHSQSYWMGGVNKQSFYYRHEGEEGPSDCSVHGFSTIQEAKEDIDEKYETGKYK
jgi:hypothetical protein